MKNFGATPLIFLVLVSLLVGGYFLFRGAGLKSIQETAQKVGQTVTGSGDFDFNENTPGYDNYIKLSQGCPFKDCIPSIDDPKFELVDKANEWLKDTDVVFVVEYKSKVRAYPQRIMSWHELVNDEIEGEPILISFCPLCGSALAFERMVDGKTLEFGVSGKLHNNDLVIYDRATNSLWQQITTEAIVGEHFGKKLSQISMSGMLWGEFRDEFKKAEVLSRETGHIRDYDRYPYGNYEEDISTFFPVEGGIDSTIHPKEVVYGVLVKDLAKAYQEKDIKSKNKITDEIKGVRIEILYNKGNVKFKADGKEIPGTRLFWFAWKAFYPDTDLY